jgi:hypothetical protein
VKRPTTADLEGLLRALADANVEFIIVGGVAAVLHGVPINTHDLDIVPAQTAENLDRLHAVLQGLSARFRPVRPDRDLPVTLEHLRGTGQLLLSTNLGPLDILCRLHDGRGHGDLTASELGAPDLRVKVLDLDALIAIKRSTGRAKDQAMVPLLLAVQARLKP